jgi:hypothetical protein
MKIPRASLNCNGLTLFELLLVVAVLLFLMLILVGIVPHSPPKRRATTLQCLNNQKQISLGLLMWQGDHDRKFPWQLSTTTNGTMELISDGHVASQFQVLSNYLPGFNVYHCPADTTRPIGTDYKTLSDTNISYFVNVAAGSQPWVLTGDRHLVANGNAVKSGMFVFTNGMAMNWTRDFHYTGTVRGGMAFTDGHAEAIQGPDLTAAFNRHGTNETRLLVP